MQIKKMIYFGFPFKRTHSPPVEICNAIMGLVSIYQAPIYFFFFTEYSNYMQLSHLDIINFSIDHIQKKSHLRTKGHSNSSNRIHNNSTDNFHSFQYLLGILFVSDTLPKTLYALINSIVLIIPGGRHYY